MKTAIEQIEALCYKLRMLSVQTEGPADVYCDNEAVYIRIQCFLNLSCKKT
jgi:hypothetical protein